MRKSPQYARRSIMHLHAQPPSSPATHPNHGPHRLAVTAQLDAAFLADLLRSTPTKDVAREAAAAAAASDGDASADSEAVVSDEDDDEMGEEGEGSGEGSRVGSETEGMEGVEVGTAAVAAVMAAAAAAAAASAGNGNSAGKRVKGAVQRAMDYVQGLLWTLSMYFSGGELGAELFGASRVLMGGGGVVRLCLETNPLHCNFTVVLIVSTQSPPTPQTPTPLPSRPHQSAPTTGGATPMAAPPPPSS